MFRNASEGYLLMTIVGIFGAVAWYFILTGLFGIVEQGIIAPFAEATGTLQGIYTK